MWLGLQDLLEDDALTSHGTDASGNPILKDIGMFLKAELKKVFKDADIKYIDPSYIIRWDEHAAARVTAIVVHLL